MLTALAPFDGDTILPLADARVQLNLTADDTFHDDAVTSARDIAISWVEDYTGRSLQAREFLWEVDQFRSAMRLPRGPVESDGVTDVSYYDSDGADTAVDAADWFVGSGVLAAATGSTWPYADGSPGGVRISFTAGYTLAEEIPPHLLGAVKLAMTAFFENRNDPNLKGAMMLADQFRAIL